jgi:MoxR-like ATPase
MPIAAETVDHQRRLLEPFFSGAQSILIGQNRLIRRLMIGLLTDGHILLEGVPGLAKTLTVRTIAQLLDLKFQRIQFTPDLLPADVIGTQIYNPRSGEFTVKPGPVFANIVLADEINRAPAKVQSALLEAMQDRQVTIGETTLLLPNPFFVMATQNPIEQEGTYPLPEAQVDRFMLRVRVDYPSKEDELIMLDRVGSVDASMTLSSILDLATLKLLRGTVDQIHVDTRLKAYLVDLIRATRPASLPQRGEFAGLIQHGASPRASIALFRASKAHAFLENRHFVLPEDIKSMAIDVLNHRVQVSFEAEAKEIHSSELVQRIIDSIPVP